MAIPIWHWSAVDTAAAIREGRATSEEVVQAHIDRMHAANPAINAIVVDLSAQAIEAARAADRALAQGARPGKLQGVPVTIKINIDVEGQANSNGVVAFKDNIAPGDSPVTANLNKAGAIIIGMTNTPEFSMRGFTDNPLHGPTLNPLEQHDHLRRLVGRCGCVDRIGHRRDRARQRYRRLAALAGLLQRHRHDQTDAGAHSRVQPERASRAPADRTVHVRAGTTRPRSARRPPGPGGHEPTRHARSLVGARPAGRTVPGEADQGRAGPHP